LSFIASYAISCRFSLAPTWILVEQWLRMRRKPVSNNTMISIGYDASP
jgi:hypothetical protein